MIVCDMFHVRKAWRLGCKILSEILVHMGGYNPVDAKYLMTNVADKDRRKYDKRKETILKIGKSQRMICYSSHRSSHHGKCEKTINETWKKGVSDEKNL